MADPTARASADTNVQPPPPISLGTRRMPAALMVWLVALTVFAYLPALLWGGYIWDDDQYVVKNDNLRSVEGLKNIWLHPESIPQYYPLVHTSYWIEYHLWGVEPVGYHAVNIVIHAVNAILLWLVLVRLKVPGAAIAAFIFAVHPVEVESVAWITERKNTLSCLFYLSSLYVLLPVFGVHGGKADVVQNVEKPAVEHPWRFAIGLLLFLCALGSKTVTASLPAAILVITWWKHSRIRLRDVVWTIPLFVVGVAAGLYTAHLERTHVGASGAEFDQTLIERCLIASRALWFYAGKLAWPTDLIFIYERWDVNAAIWWWWLYPIGIAAVVAGLWLARNKIGRGPLAAVFLFAGTLFPALGFLNVYPHRFSFVADHFQYHASIALITLAAAAGVTLVRRFNTTAVRWAAGGMFAALIAIYTFATMQQSTIYRDKQTLWTDVIEKNDKAFIAYTNLATVVLREARDNPWLDDGKQLNPQMQHAMDLLHRGLELYPDAVSYHNLGEAYLIINEYEKAIPLLERSIEIEPLILRHRLTLARAYRDIQMYDKARHQFEEIIELHPPYFAASNNLARMYLEADDDSFRDPQKAIDVAEAGVTVTQRKVPHLLSTLAAAYASAGRYDEAIATAEETIELAQIGGPRFAGIKTRMEQKLDDYRRLADAAEAQEPFEDAPAAAPD